MLTSIIKATRAHYAALQHRPSPDRVALDYEVPGHTAGTIWVIARTNAQRSANLTKLSNRLQSMYPEAKHVECSYRRMPESETVTGTVKAFAWPTEKPIRNVTANVKCVRCGEPDARGYECESCGKSKVYGAEELMFHVQA